MTTPVLTIRDDQLATEAGVEMLRAGINHLVVVDAGGRVLGIVSAASLMAPDALSPIALRWSIAAAHDEAQVIAAARLIPDIFVSLVETHIDAAVISRIVTLQNDALTQRLLELAIERHGPPPVPYAWLALGSGGRGELSLSSDQDNALAYADTDDPDGRRVLRARRRRRQPGPRRVRVRGVRIRRHGARPPLAHVAVATGSRSSIRRSRSGTTTTRCAPAWPSTSAGSPATSTS